MSVRTDVLGILLPIQPRSSVIMLAEALIDAASAKETSDAALEALRAVEERLSDLKRPLLNQAQMTIYERARGDRATFQDYKLPDFIETLVVVLYLRSKSAIQSAGYRPVFDADSFRKVKPRLDDLSDDFFGEVIVESGLRAYRDPVFAQTLGAASTEIRTLIPQLDALRAGAGKIFLKKGDQDECSCIVSACNNLGDCRDFCIETWWACALIFLGIIIILILTA